MKILLLKPIDKIHYIIQPNLGLGYLATIMLENGADVAILDSAREDLSWDGFSKRIKEEKYDLIGIQMLTFEIPSVKKHIDIIKRYSPETTIVIGGPHISGDPKGTMNLLNNIDFGFAGEAEIGMERFLNIKKDDYANAALLREIPSLIWRQNGRVMINYRRSFEDLDKIKFPAWQHISPLGYPLALHGIFYRKTPVAPMIISRGCPFQCAFCAGKSVTGQNIRYRSIRNVLDEITFLYNKYGVREIHIEDDNFTFKKEYVVNFCNEIIKSGLDIAFALPNGTRLDTLDEEMLRLMERAGFYSMAVGIESGSDRVLKLMNKNLSTDMIKKKIELIKRYTKIDLTGFFLIGYPQETESEILATIAFAKSLKLDKASFVYPIPFPGSGLWDRYNEKDAQKVAWGDFFPHRVIKSDFGIPTEKLKKLQRKAFREFYLRPKIIFKLLRQAKVSQQIKAIVERLINIFIWGS